MFFSLENSQHFVDDRFVAQSSVLLTLWITRICNTPDKSSLEQKYTSCPIVEGRGDHTSLVRLPEAWWWGSGGHTHRCMLSLHSLPISYCFLPGIVPAFYLRNRRIPSSDCRQQSWIVHSWCCPVLTLTATKDLLSPSIWSKPQCNQYQSCHSSHNWPCPVKNKKSEPCAVQPTYFRGLDAPATSLVNMPHCSPELCRNNPTALD